MVASMIFLQQLGDGLSAFACQIRYMTNPWSLNWVEVELREKPQVLYDELSVAHNVVAPAILILAQRAHIDFGIREILISAVRSAKGYVCSMFMCFKFRDSLDDEH